jgi:hypothetical protein
MQVFRNNMGTKSDPDITQCVPWPVRANAHQPFGHVFTHNRIGAISREIPASRPKSVDDYTCITFKPDLGRFKMDSLDKDIIALFTKRAYDMAGVLV